MYRGSIQRHFLHGQCVAPRLHGQQRCLEALGDLGAQSGGPGLWPFRGSCTCCCCSISFSISLTYIHTRCTCACMQEVVVYTGPVFLPTRDPDSGKWVYHIRTVGKPVRYIPIISIAVSSQRSYDELILLLLLLFCGCWQNHPTLHPSYENVVSVAANTDDRNDYMQARTLD